MALTNNNTPGAKDSPARGNNDGDFVATPAAAAVDPSGSRAPPKRRATDSAASDGAAANLSPSQLAALLALLQKQVAAPAVTTPAATIEAEISASAKTANVRNNISTSARVAAPTRADKGKAPAVEEEPAAPVDINSDSDSDEGEEPNNPSPHLSNDLLPPLPSPHPSTAAAAFNRKGVHDQAEVFEALQTYLAHMEHKIRAVLTSRSFKMVVADMAALKRMKTGFPRGNRSFSREPAAFMPKSMGGGSGCRAFKGTCFRCGQHIRGPLSGLGFESQRVHFGHPSAGGCQSAAAVAEGPLLVACTSPLNVVEQRDKCRLILDLRKVNQYLVIPEFKYEGLARVTELAQPGDWMFSIDLKSGYHHVDIHPSCWKFLGFHFDSTDYYFKSLPFGLATTPFLFTQLIKQLARKWRAQGTRVILYVDDILFLCQSKENARATRNAIIRDLRQSGLVINAKKSHLTPTQKLQFLGMELDTQSGRFTIGPERRAQLMHTLRVLLTAYERGQRIPIRLVARVTGILASMALALGTTARAFGHQLLELINTAPSWNGRTHLTLEACDELKFWLDNFDPFNGAPFHMPHSIDTVIHVDASAHSWGATLASFPGENLQGSSPMPHELLTTSSTRRELEGVLWALRTFSNQIQGLHVLMRVDNQGVFFILRKGGSGQPELTLLCKSIIALCMANEIRLAIEWIPLTLNVEADALSKLEDNDDYSLKLPWFRLLERRWGPHTVDLFTNAINAQLSRSFRRSPTHVQLPSTPSRRTGDQNTDLHFPLLT
ncbi:unnamed protein product [Closterium sp. NIES-53]